MYFFSARFISVYACVSFSFFLSAFFALLHARFTNELSFGKTSKESKPPIVFTK